MAKNIKSLITGRLLFTMGNNRSINSIILLFLVLSGCASNIYNPGLWGKAKSLYDKGEYIKAAELFDQIIEIEKAPWFNYQGAFFDVCLKALQ